MHQYKHCSRLKSVFDIEGITIES